MTRLSDERMCAGREFQLLGEDTQKAREAKDNLTHVYYLVFSRQAFINTVTSASPSCLMGRQQITSYSFKVKLTSHRFLPHLVTMHRTPSKITPQTVIPSRKQVRLLLPTELSSKFTPRFYLSKTLLL